MILKVGNQSFSSEDVPVAVVLNWAELAVLIEIAKRKQPPYTCMAKPKDVPAQVAWAWLSEAITEFPLNPAETVIIGQTKKGQD